MSERSTFRLFNRGKVVRFEVISDLHWKVVDVSGGAEFRIGDEVSPVPWVPWQRARRRVNGRRTALSLTRLALLRGEGVERSDDEVKFLLATRPWDPEPPPPAA